jgi:hypothetical protein
MIDRETWWQDKATKGQKLLDDIRIVADRAQAAGFTTTEYILNLAATELTKDIESSGPQDNKS